MSNAEQGSPSSYKSGNLKRQLDTVTIATLDPSFSDGAAAFTVGLKLEGLSGNLHVQVAAGYISAHPEAPILPSMAPAGGGTIQLTPRNDFKDANPMWLRPLFQNPVGPQNINVPLPQDLPFGWEFVTEADSVPIDIVLTPTLFIGTALDGTVAVQVTVEYIGNWWDGPTIQLAIGKVRITGVSQPILIGTQGGG